MFDIVLAVVLLGHFCAPPVIHFQGVPAEQWCTLKIKKVHCSSYNVTSKRILLERKKLEVNKTLDIYQKIDAIGRWKRENT